MLFFLLACGPQKEPEFVGEFLVDPVELGAPRAQAGTVQNAAGIGSAMAAALPVFGEDPAWSTPHEVFEVLQLEVVQDEGVCPAAQVLDDGYRWVSDCRSTDGYEFSGTAEERTWDAEDGHRSRLESDLDVVGDVEGAKFQKISLHGFVEQVIPEEGEVVQHLDLNLQLAVSGYWEIKGPSDPRLSQWTDWRLTGSMEEQSDGGWVVDVVVQSGDGFLFGSNDLKIDDGCPVELKGDATLGDGVTATFGGVKSCDACAEVTDADGPLGSACAP